jgi:hypothetical protein
MYRMMPIQLERKNWPITEAKNLHFRNSSYCSYRRSFLITLTANQDQTRRLQNQLITMRTSRLLFLSAFLVNSLLAGGSDVQVSSDVETRRKTCKF